MPRKLIWKAVSLSFGLCAVALWLNGPALPSYARAYPQEASSASVAPQEGDFVVRDFHFHTGETLPELRLHYITLGQPARDSTGHVTNAVVFLHGTGGSGHQFLSPEFLGVLFGPGQLLDASHYFIILPDAIGHGHSSKPSDGMHAHFPHYDYEDMVRAQHRLIFEKLGVNHFRLVAGASMGCMHAWMWGEMYPDSMDALLPIACQPVQIAGRNRMTRKMVTDLIRNDPDWKNGEYSTQPRSLQAAIYIQMIMVKSPLQQQTDFPTRDAADRYLDEWVKPRVAAADANDMLYEFDASRNYDPSSALNKIQAHVTAINSADDFINPPELRLTEREIEKVKNGRYVLLPITSQTRGHGTAMLPAIWQSYLAELLRSTRPK